LKTAQLAATELSFLSIPKQDSQAEASQWRRAWKKLPSCTSLMEKRRAKSWVRWFRKEGSAQEFVETCISAALYRKPLKTFGKSA
jgi:hypothetical protein